MAARGCRQLQHSGTLSGREPGDQYDLAAGEFQRIVVHIRVVHIHLTKPGDPVTDARPAEQTEGAVVLNVGVKAISVPGSRQTATSGSPAAAKPRVIDFAKSVAISVSPTVAGGNDQV